MEWSHKRPLKPPLPGPSGIHFGVLEWRAKNKPDNATSASTLESTSHVNAGLVVAPKRPLTHPRYASPVERSLQVRVGHERNSSGKLNARLVLD